MSDCTNISIREQLPDFMHGTLGPQEQSAVQLHLGACADCAAELALLEAIRASRDLVLPSPSPAIEVSHIVAAIPPYQARMRTFGTSFRIAAAFLVAAVGIGTFAVTRDQGMPDPMPTPAVVAATEPVVAESGIGLVNVDQLSDEQLEELIGEVQLVDPDWSWTEELIEPELLGGAGFSELGDI